MKIRFFKILEKVSTSYWLLPLAMSLCGIALALFFVWLGDNIPWKSEGRLNWIFYAKNPAGALNLLSVIASSMINVAGVVFSITIVALSLASQQFGPRLLRNFLDDRKNQFVLGVFLSTFLYCLILMPSLRKTGEQELVPFLSVIVGVALAVLSLMVLIYFFHHVSTSIQGNHLVEVVGKELIRSLEELYPDKEDTPPLELAPPSLPKDFEKNSLEVHFQAGGYIQAFDEEKILDFCRNQGLVVRLNFRRGSFIFRGSTLARVYPQNKVKPELANCLNESVAVGPHRTPFQDPLFIFYELLEVGLRALSPGINDPFTAIEVIHRLGEAFALLGGRRLPSSFLYHDNRNVELALVAPKRTMVEYLRATFIPLLQNAQDHFNVYFECLRTFKQLAPFFQRKEDLDELRDLSEVAIKLASLRPVLNESIDKLEEKKRELIVTVLQALDHAKV